MTTDISKFNNKPISEMSFGELVSASFKLSGMHDDLMEKREHPKFKEKMKNQPTPPINPAFTNMQNIINDEIKKRIEK